MRWLPARLAVPCKQVGKVCVSPAAFYQESVTAKPTHAAIKLHPITLCCVRATAAMLQCAPSTVYAAAEVCGCHAVVPAPALLQTRT